MALVKNKISFIVTLLVVVIASIGGYYILKLKQGPYSASKFVSISYRWGVGDTLLNSYNSATGEYQYLDQKDTLIKTTVKLHANNVIFLHAKANELDFWQLPEVMINDKTELKSKEVLRYEIIFNYEGKSKKITFYTNYTDNMAFATTAQALQKIVAQTINEAEERYSQK